MLASFKAARNWCDGSEIRRGRTERVAIGVLGWNCSSALHPWGGGFRRRLRQIKHNQFLLE
jgi:hypothetical protein